MRESLKQLRSLLNQSIYLDGKADRALRRIAELEGVCARLQCVKVSQRYGAVSRLQARPNLGSPIKF